MSGEPGFRRLLFAVDDTETSRLALPLVAGYARAWHADLHLLHVHLADRDPPVSRAGDGLVSQMVDALARLGVGASGQVHVSHQATAAAAIARTAGQQEADLVVVGSHGRTGLEALFVRGVSHALAAELSTPVLVARVAPGLRLRPIRVMVAIGASRAADIALADAIRVARPTNAAVRVLHVQDSSEPLPEADSEASSLVERGLATIRGSGLEADQEVVLAGGSTAEAIAVAARRFDADVVVVASRRPTDLQGFLVGSVAYGLIHALERPVLLAQRG